jgi:hypothetical protein
MPKIVVILGAGASADFEAHVLADVFKDSQARQYLQVNQNVKQMLQDTFWGPRGYGLKTSDQSLTIEDVLTILRDWEKEDRIKEEQRPQSLADFRRKLYVLIQKAVFEGKSTRGTHLNPLIKISRQKFDHITWVSFKWDCIFEAFFWYSQTYWGPGSRVNLTLAIAVSNWRDGTQKHLFLKLHGGINWWLINNLPTYVEWSGGGNLSQKWSDYDSNRTPDRPIILEPSYYKYGDDMYQLLHPQWEAFFDRLVEAGYVVVVGYSLPESDSLARSKIVTAFQVNQSCRWLLIDPSEGVGRRYRGLLGQERLKIRQMTLAAFNNEIRANLQDAFPEFDFSEPAQQAQPAQD